MTALAQTTPIRRERLALLNSMFQANQVISRDVTPRTISLTEGGNFVYDPVLARLDARLLQRSEAALNEKRPPNGVLIFESLADALNYRGRELVVVRSKYHPSNYSLDEWIAEVTQRKESGALGGQANVVESGYRQVQPATISSLLKSGLLYEDSRCGQSLDPVIEPLMEWYTAAHPFVGRDDRFTQQSFQLDIFWGKGLAGHYDHPECVDGKRIHETVHGKFGLVCYIDRDWVKTNLPDDRIAAAKMWTPEEVLFMIPPGWIGVLPAGKSNGVYHRSACTTEVRVFRQMHLSTLRD
jgi:hypothetical protein